MPLNHLYIIYKFAPAAAHWNREKLIRNPSLNIPQLIDLGILNVQNLDHFRELSFNSNVTRAFLEEYLDISTWDWRGLSRLRWLTFDFVVACALKQKRWDLATLAANPGLILPPTVPPGATALEHKLCINLQNLRNEMPRVRQPRDTMDDDKFISTCKNFDYLSTFPGLQMSHYFARPHSGWKMEYLSCHPNFWPDQILAAMARTNGIWSIKYFSKNNNLTWRLVIDNPRLAWDYDSLSGNSFLRFNAAVTIQRAWRRRKIG